MANPINRCLSSRAICCYSKNGIARREGVEINERENVVVAETRNIL